MKKQIFNPYLPPWEYIPDGEPRVLTIDCIYMVVMTALTESGIAKMTM